MEEEMKVVSKYFQMINLVVGLGNEKTDKTSKKVDNIIDDEMLNKFTLFYAGKTIDELEIYEKEEVRYILKEQMMMLDRILKKGI